MHSSYERVIPCDKATFENRSNAFLSATYCFFVPKRICEFILFYNREFHSLLVGFYMKIVIFVSESESISE